MTVAVSAYADLVACVRACTACGLAGTRTNVVVGSGPVPAPLLLVGEAPGAHEDASGVPFAGRAGQLLDRLLAEAGAARADVAVVNVVKCRPPGNRVPARAEVESCRPWLTAQLALIDPRVVVTLGATAAGWAFGRGARLTELRNRPHLVDGRTVVATYHPSAALRFGPRGRPAVALRDDLALAIRLVG